MRRSYSRQLGPAASRRGCAAGLAGSTSAGGRAVAPGAPWRHHLRRHGPRDDRRARAGYPHRTDTISVRSLPRRRRQGRHPAPSFRGVRKAPSGADGRGGAFLGSVDDLGWTPGRAGTGAPAYPKGAVSPRSTPSPRASRLVDTFITGVSQGTCYLLPLGTWRVQYVEPYREARTDLSQDSSRTCRVGRRFAAPLRRYPAPLGHAASRRTPRHRFQRHIAGSPRLHRSRAQDEAQRTRVSNLLVLRHQRQNPVGIRHSPSISARSRFHFHLQPDVRARGLGPPLCGHKPQPRRQLERQRRKRSPRPRHAAGRSE